MNIKVAAFTVSEKSSNKQSPDSSCFMKEFSEVKVVGDPCQKITLLLLKSKSVRVIVPESCF